MCMIDNSDGYSTVLHERIQTARKEHGCTECGRKIKIGEAYLNEATVFEGRKKTHKTCAHCQVVRGWLSGECGGYVYGRVFEDISEHAWEGYGIRVKMMAVGMERYWMRKDGKSWPLPRLPKASGHEARHG